jgi:hypothetical protein
MIIFIVPDLDPQDPYVSDLLDPDPLINKPKNYENLDFFCIGTS